MVKREKPGWLPTWSHGSISHCDAIAERLLALSRACAQSMRGSVLSSQQGEYVSRRTVRETFMKTCPSSVSIAQSGRLRMHESSRGRLRDAVHGGWLKRYVG